MSYLVFARKWRPLTFDDVVGQEHITSTIKKAIEKNRVAHAYIFTGTRGVGKTTTARILARALNCEKGPTVTPCGECDSCRSIIGGSSFDVLEIDGASNNSVDDIRGLRENIGYSSMGGKHRIFVIDEVHMLSKSAFNALLKTLEEPPKNVIFIFATTEPQKIPATIHSRCQRYDFRRISAEQILDRLAHICTEEKIQFERPALMLVARKADGSMRDGLSLLDQVYSFCQDNLSEKEVRSVLGLVGMEIYRTVMDAVWSKTPSAVLQAVHDVLHQGYDLHEFIEGLEEHLRNLLFARIPGALESRGIDLDPETAKSFSEQALRFPEGDLLRMVEIVRRTEYDLKWSAYPRFLIETALLKLVYLDSTVSIEKMLSLLGGGADATGSPEDPAQKKKSELTPPAEPASVEDKAPIPVPPPSPELSYVNEERGGAEEDRPSPDTVSNNESFAETRRSVSARDLHAGWPQFLESLLRDRPNLGSFLSLGYISSSSGDALELRFSSDFRFQYMEVTRHHNRDEITRLIHAFFGVPVELRITLESAKPESAGQNYIKQLGNIAPSINDEIEKEPIIQSVLDIFDGEIIG